VQTVILNEKKRRKIVVGILFSGGLLTIVSVLLNSNPVALIALGLLLWGTILLFVRKPERTHSALIIEQMFNLMLTLDDVLSARGFRRNAIFFPPRFSGDNPTMQIENDRTGEAIILVPTGVELESTDGKATFSEEGNLGNYSLNEISLHLTNTLQVVIELETELQKGLIRARITDPILRELLNLAMQNHSQILTRVPPPIISAVACTLARTTHKPVVIENISLPRRNVTDVHFKLLDSLDGREDVKAI